MRVSASIDVGAPCEAVWKVIADPDRYLEFMSGITRWEVVSEQREGIGLRCKMLLLVGSAEVGGLIEMVEWSEPRDIAWASVTGVDQRGRWRLRQHRPDRTHVELRLSYGVAGGGIFGSLAERVAARTVRGHLRRSVQQLKRVVEHEQYRERAAQRKRAAAA
jgi:uncharacterized membrane protein